MRADGLRPRCAAQRRQKGRRCPFDAPDHGTVHRARPPRQNPPMQRSCHGRQRRDGQARKIPFLAHDPVDSRPRPFRDGRPYRFAYATIQAHTTLRACATLRCGIPFVPFIPLNPGESRTKISAYPRGSSCDEDAIGHRLGSCGAMDEARDHGLELIAPVVAPGEASKVALGMIRTDLAVGPGDRALDIAERRIDPFEGGRADGKCLRRTAGAPSSRWCAVPRWRGALRRPRAADSGCGP